ncbi:MAG TPA: DUF2339 domain-containing protein [Solirubrobacteraceae bacterium]|nr:DUF2339 domain-containing protein [Solirubrobacteraceae bacterium]
MTIEARLDALEARTAALEASTGKAWRWLAPVELHHPLPNARLSPGTLVSDEAVPPAGPPPPPAAPAPAAPRLELEDLLGGRLLAWVGGAAVVLGLCFLLAIAVSRGWLGEVERTLLAGSASLAMLALGTWLHGHRGRTDAARAAASAGIAGLFATAVVASSVYDLVPALVALVGSLAVGITATALALRWEAKGIAALGILGALLAPAVVGALGSGEAVALLMVASAAAAAVLVWQRWPWLAFGSFVIATPQWFAYLVIAVPSAPVTIAVLAGFGALTAAAAVGFELRSSAGTMPVGSMLLLALNALLIGTVGALALETAVADGWLVCLAAIHLLAGVAARRSQRVADEIAFAALTLGVVLADVAAARLLDGLPLVGAWAGSSLLFAGLVRLAAPGRDRMLVTAGLGSHLLLALSHALAAAPPETLSGGPQDLAGLAALALVAAGTAVSGRLAADGHQHLRATLDGIALAVVGYQTAIALDGVGLTVALAGEAVALVLVARRSGDEVASGAAAAFAGAALLHALAVLAPPAALVVGLAAPLEAAVALVAAAAGIAAAGLVQPAWRSWALAAAAVIELYAASVELVTPFQPGLDTRGLLLTDLDVRQQGQALLSTLWAVVGVATLVVGLVRDNAAVRRGALALLALTVGKVFLYDLASLTSLYRAGSFVALGLLLLGGAYAWQRIRPQPVPDLRTVPGAVR